jgi:hypothetical protein
VTTIEQDAPVGTAAVNVAWEPALTGDVTDTSLTLPDACLGGGVAALRQRKARTGCSSIPFGATPVWPCMKSKNATPVTLARVQTRTCCRANAI